MARVRKDAKGLYVITNGSRYRPVVSTYTYGQIYTEHRFLGVGESWPTEVKEGDLVKASHIAQSCKARIRYGDKEEIWSTGPGDEAVYLKK